MKYRIEVAPQALKEMRKIPDTDLDRIIRTIDNLSVEPRPPGVKKLIGADDLYRIRCGNYRVIYRIEDHILLVLVVRVAHRKDVYKKK